MESLTMNFKCIKNDSMMFLKKDVCESRSADNRNTMCHECPGPNRIMRAGDDPVDLVKEDQNQKVKEYKKTVEAGKVKCSDCEKMIAPGGKSGMCIKCFNNSRIKPEEKYFCIDCGKEISIGSASQCRECYMKGTKKEKEKLRCTECEAETSGVGKSDLCLKCSARKGQRDHLKKKIDDLVKTLKDRDEKLDYYTERVSFLDDQLIARHDDVLSLKKKLAVEKINFQSEKKDDSDINSIREDLDIEREKYKALESSYGKVVNNIKENKKENCLLKESLKSREQTINGLLVSERKRVDELDKEKTIPVNDNQILLDFSGRADLLKSINKLAKHELRTPTNQVTYLLDRCWVFFEETDHSYIRDNLSELKRSLDGVMFKLEHNK